VEVMETATPTAGEFLEVCAVFVAVVGSWLGLGFHDVGELGIAQTNGNVDRIGGNRTPQTPLSKNHSPLSHLISSPKTINITELTAIAL
jgi:hypothetical protein